MHKSITISETPMFKQNCLCIVHTMAGVKWYIHENDADICEPSCPHCHTDEKPWKLNIYTGEIYSTKSNSYIGKSISKTDLKRMWAKKEFRDLVIRERKRYEILHMKDPVRYPVLPPLPPLKMRHGKNKLIVSKKWISCNIRILCRAR